MPNAVVISPSEGYHTLRLKDVPLLRPGPQELLLQIVTAALKHRDLYIRQNLYPSISFENSLLADACALVRPHPGQASRHLHLPASVRELINPGSGWLSDPEGPEGPYTVHGGTSPSALGMLQEYVVVPAAELELAPDHLSEAEAAALPLTGLTAWRALSTKSSNAKAGRNILVTGIGGDVALMVLLFGVAKGCNVYVRSSSQPKINRAKSLGPKSGVLYTEEDGWPKALRKLLPHDRSFLDAVIDGAGGDIVDSTWKLVKLGGVIVSYSITSMAQPNLPMQAVMKNTKLRGSTMGSRRSLGKWCAL
ncbi:MAG: hypothetical protein Q9226_003787 [Calogaya cf. arnoldii]